MSALQGGPAHAAAPASRPTASYRTDTTPPARTWHRIVVAGSAALSVWVLVLCSIGVLFVAAIAIGLDLLGAPMAIVWPAAGVAGLVATAGSCRLAYGVWRYEIDEATDIV